MNRVSVVLLAAFGLTLLTLLTAAAPVRGLSEPVSAQGLQADLKILEQALLALHPGLGRYGRRDSIEVALRELEAKARSPMTLPEAYLELSRFLATIGCGHTYANFWNQSEEIQQSLFGNADKVPFTFRLVKGRMMVEGSATQSPRIARGVEILALDGIPAADVISRLLPLISADGSNDGQRVHALELSGVGEFEPFDVFFPLVFLPRDEGLSIEARDLREATAEPFTVVEPRVGRDRRAQAIAERSGEGTKGPDDLWRFEILDHPTGPIGYLALGTFVTWKMELDWKAFLADAFARLQQQSAPDLILDLRGNAGGDDAVNATLLRYLVTRPIQTPAGSELLRYDKVPPSLAPYLDTWDASIKDLSSKVEPVADGFFRRRGTRDQGRTIQPRDGAYGGRVYLLIDAANSSATFLLARLLGANGLATLVGQETGGNLRGTNGGQMFFLRLPNTGLEVDIPLIGWFPQGHPTDAGLRPDVLVEPEPEDVLLGVDRALERARELIVESRAASSPAGP